MAIDLLVSHRILDHFHSSLPHLGNGSRDICYFLYLKLFQKVVNSNKCTSTTNASAAWRKIMKFKQH